MAKIEITKVQLLDALQTHKNTSSAAKALGITYPDLQKYMRRHGICAGHLIKIQHPEAIVVEAGGRNFGKTSIAEWFRKKLGKED